MLEKQLAARVMKWLKQRGHYAVKTTGVSVAGTPDIITCVGGRFVAIELKAECNLPTPLQLHHLRRVANSGGLAFVCRSVADVAKVLHTP